MKSTFDSTLQNEFYDYDSACIKIANKLSRLEEPSLKDIYSFIKSASSKYHLSRTPKFQDIIKHLPIGSNIRKTMMVRPVKTASGIMVITVMAKPYDCPHGRCIYCPGGKEFNIPLSYTGKEPVTKLAQKFEYDPKSQVSSKLEREVSRGHNVSKVELVIVGGTFLY